jgi:hypothetical protein
MERKPDNLYSDDARRIATAYRASTWLDDFKVNYLAAKDPGQSPGCYIDYKAAKKLYHFVIGKVPASKVAIYFENRSLTDRKD